MATYLQIQDRIIRETNRDDLADALPSDDTAVSIATLKLVIDQSIQFYSNERFWFNEQIDPISPATSATVVGQNYVNIPDGVEFFDRLSIQVGGSRYTLNRVELTDWDRVAGYVTSQGQPIIYAVMGATVKLWPTPSAIYNLVWVTVSDQSPLVLDADSNAWTTFAQDLIAFRSRYLLMRDYFRDVSGAQIAKAAELEALTNLRTLTAQKIAVGSLRSNW